MNEDSTPAKVDNPDAAAVEAAERQLVADVAPVWDAIAVEVAHRENEGFTPVLDSYEIGASRQAGNDEDPVIGYFSALTYMGDKIMQKEGMRSNRDDSDSLLRLGHAFAAALEATERLIQVSPAKVRAIVARVTGKSVEEGDTAEAVRWMKERLEGPAERFQRAAQMLEDVRY